MAETRSSRTTAAASAAAAAAARLAAAAARRIAGAVRWRCWSCSPAALVLLDTAPGHRFIVDRIARFETASGLRIRIGRIDGSIFGKTQLQERARRRYRGRVPDLARDQARLGAGRLALQRLHIDRRRADLVRLDRLPKLKPTGAQGADPARLRHPYRRAARSTGSSSARRLPGRRERPRCAARRTSAPGGRWSSSAWRCDGGDRIALQPRRRARPRPLRHRRRARARRRTGCCRRCVGTERPIDLTIERRRQLERGGAGTAALDLSGRPAARLALGVDTGRYRPVGQAGAGAIPQGQAAAADRADGAGPRRRRRSKDRDARRRS